MTKKIFHRTLLATAAFAALSSGAVHAASGGGVAGTLNALTGNGAALAGVPGSNSSLQSLAHNLDNPGSPGGSPLAGLKGLPLGNGDLPALEGLGLKDGPVFTTDSVGLNKTGNAKLAGIDLSPTMKVVNGDKLLTMANDNGKGSVTLRPEDNGKVTVGAKADYAAGDDLTGPIAYRYDVDYTTP